MARLVTIHIDKLELDVVMGVFIHMATSNGSKTKAIWKPLLKAHTHMYFDMALG